MSALAAWALGALGTLGAILGGIGTLRSASSTKEALKASPYDALARRVVTLEEADSHKGEEIQVLRAEKDTQADQLTALQRAMNVVVEDRDGLLAYVKVLWTWAVSGRKPPPPTVPDHLHDLLPPLSWPDHTDTD